jgi:hypothetical protein
MDDYTTVPPPPPPPEPPYPGGGVTLPPAYPAAPPAPQALPWEQPGYPVLEALFETAKLFISEPGEAFKRMSLTASLGRPIGYAIIFGWLGIIAGQLYQIALGGAWMRFLPSMPHSEEMPFASPSFWTLGWSVAMMVVAPLLILIGLFIGAAIVHLFLLLVGGANSGFDATVRVMCYASTVQILQVVPMCGGVAAAIWGLVLQVTGLAIAHRTTQGKAALAVLLPVALCCVCVAVLFVAFGAMILAAIGGAIAHSR